MPLTHVRLQNFKCFRDSGHVPLAGLTLIFGRNNTGKSSILQSLLLLKQSIDNPEYGPRLRLRGPLYTVGAYSDIAHQHEAKRHVAFEFGVRPERNGGGVLRLEFRSDEPQPPRLLRLRVQAEGVDALEIRTSRGAGGPYELAIGGKAIGREKQDAAGFAFTPSRFLPLLSPEPRSKSRAVAISLLHEFERVLQSLRAVDAFRRKPERRYEYQGRTPDAIDIAGENVVNALIEDSVRRRRRRSELLAGVNRWLKEVGRVRLLPLRRISRTARLFELRIKDTDSGRWANFADVGFGIGQALPVLVEGLRTGRQGLFLVQEPEIHLHPDAQLAMGDFLLELSRGQRFVIAETHSENLLLRVRRLLVERGDLEPSAVSVIHVDKTRDGPSLAHALGLDEIGQVANWPAGFMEETTDERLALMKAMTSRLEERDSDA